MIDQSNMPGMDGFRWWTGIVEDRKDPEKLSRMQIRMYVWHTDDKSLIPTEKLFWAIPIFPTNNSNQTYTAKEGDAVFGFWIDSKDFQQPYVFGRLPDKPGKLYPATKGFSDPGKWMGDRPVEVASRSLDDSGKGLEYTDASPRRYPDPLNEQTNSRFARNDKLENTPLPFIREHIIKNVETAFGETWDEVNPEYAAVYPYNDSKQSESGHFIDVDDTRRKERINLMHRTGTMQEMRPSGSIHRKDLKHSISMIHGCDFKNVRGNLWHTVEKWTRYRSKGKTLAEINYDLDIGVGKDLFVNVGQPSMKGNTGYIEINGNRIFISATEEIKICCEKIKLLGDVYGCRFYGNFFGDLEGNVLGTSKYAITAGGTGDVSDVSFYFPTRCSTETRLKPVELLTPIETVFDEVKTSKKETPEKTKEQAFKERMAAWFAMIMAPTGSPGGSGGAGQDWLYWFEDGTMGGFHSHHATGNSEVLTYIWCLGAVRAQVTECSTDQVKNYTRPDNYNCPI
jgi:hypothetical protein